MSSKYHENFKNSSFIKIINHVKFKISAKSNIMTLEVSNPHQSINFFVVVREADSLYINRALENFDALITSRDLCHFNCKRHENCPTGEFVVSFFIYDFVGIKIACFLCFFAFHF